MKISEARTILRVNGANAGDASVFPDSQLDFAIQAIGNDLARRTDVTLTTTDITIADGDEDLPAIHTDFRTERLRGEPYLVSANTLVDACHRAELSVITPAELQGRLIACGTTSQGQPAVLAFDTPGGLGRCHPIPDDAYTLRMPWVAPFTAWYPGVPLLAASVSGGAVVTPLQVISGGSGMLTAPVLSFSGGGGSGATATATVSAGKMTAGAVTAGGTLYTSAPTVYVTLAGTARNAADQTLNIPDDYLAEALMHGAVAMLQFPDLKRRFGTPAWQRYEEFVATLIGQTQAPRRRRLRARY